MQFISADLKGLVADDSWLYSGVQPHSRLYPPPPHVQVTVATASQIIQAPACASLRMISSFHRWVESEERCERHYRLREHETPAGHSWIHGRWIGHPHESGNFTALIVSTDYCFDHRNQEPETLVNLQRGPGSSRTEEVIMLHHHHNHRHHHPHHHHPHHHR